MTERKNPPSPSFTKGGNERQGQISRTTRNDALRPFDKLRANGFYIIIKVPPHPIPLPLERGEGIKVRKESKSKGREGLINGHICIYKIA